MVLIDNYSYKLKKLTRLPFYTVIGISESSSLPRIRQMALYARQELNIRATANFLLAYAATSSACCRYVKRYYVRSVQLPSDWVEVALFCKVNDGLIQLICTVRKHFVNQVQLTLAQYNTRCCYVEVLLRINGDSRDPF